MWQRLKKVISVVGIAMAIGTQDMVYAQPTSHEASTVSEISFQAYIPYIYQVSQNYIGNGETFYQATMLLEYKPDSNGIYQVTRYDQTNATHTYVYQVTEEGIYELAYFTDNANVQDLRYSELAQDAQRSLILPSKLVVGQTYRSGYHQEIERTIESIGAECWIDDSVYGEVVEIKEVVHVDGKIVVRHRYFAPYYGEILVTDSDGIPLEMLQLKQE